MKAENAYTGGMLWVMIALLAVTVAFASVRAGQAYQKTQIDVSQNQKAIKFICSTEGVLDQLVTTAADQIQTAFDNGQYQRLLRQGIATEANIRAARKTLRQYRAAHLRLENHAAACHAS